MDPRQNFMNPRDPCYLADSVNSTETENKN